MNLGLQGKHAIVTGGSRGIGKAIARELAREGADVAIVARNKADLEATARELAAETNRRIIPLAADVTSKEQVDRMVAEAAQQLGGIHILVNSGSAPGGSTTAKAPPWGSSIWVIQLPPGTSIGPFRIRPPAALAAEVALAQSATCA